MSWAEGWHRGCNGIVVSSIPGADCSVPRANKHQHLLDLGSRRPWRSRVRFDNAFCLIIKHSTCGLCKRASWPSCRAELEAPCRATGDHHVPVLTNRVLPCGHVRGQGRFRHRLNPACVRAGEEIKKLTSGLPNSLGKKKLVRVDGSIGRKTTRELGRTPNNRETSRPVWLTTAHTSRRGFELGWAGNQIGQAQRPGPNTTRRIGPLLGLH